MSGPDRFSCSRVMISTAATPGAIAILELSGDVVGVLAKLTGIPEWPLGRARLSRFGEIDDGLAVRLSEDRAQLMPHGGLRVVQRLIAWLIDHGVELASPDDLDPECVYPEAADRYEALALAAVAGAASPAAVDLLLDQPRRWRASPVLGDEDRARSKRLNRLMKPPVVVVAGPANVGKSTLSNALLGRSLSITADQPGTTRDYTSGRIDLGGLVVDWHDTPGLRRTHDSIEAKALDLARRLLEHADLVIAMTDLEQAWPVLRRDADLRVINKVDLLGSAQTRPRPPVDGHRADNEPIRTSALTGTGLSELVTAVRDRLVPPADRLHPGPWLFDPRLTQSVAAR